MRQLIFQGLKCDHLWFYGVPHSQLQQKFGDLLQGDQNHVEVSCKISHWTREFRKFAPVIARMGAHAECTCPPQNVGDNSELAPLLRPLSLPMDSDVGEPQPPLITDDTSCLSLTSDSKLPIDIANLGLICVLQWAIPP
ncbi:hypothetical protein ACB098_04G155100 [Castanea mollissima]